MCLWHASATRRLSPSRAAGRITAFRGAIEGTALVCRQSSKPLVTFAVDQLKDHIAISHTSRRIRVFARRLSQDLSAARRGRRGEAKDALSALARCGTPVNHPHPDTVSYAALDFERHVEPSLFYSLTTSLKPRFGGEGDLPAFLQAGTAESLAGHHMYRGTLDRVDFMWSWG